MEFGGAKAALFYNDTVLIYLRDNKSHINYPNQWDFPGGGREGNETPFETIGREIKEEFGIVIEESQIEWQESFPSVNHPGKQAPFFVFTLTGEQVSNITFGDEGQKWEFVDPQNFLTMDTAVEGMKLRLKTYFERYD